MEVVDVLTKQQSDGIRTWFVGVYTSLTRGRKCRSAHKKGGGGVRRPACVSGYNLQGREQLGQKVKAIIDSLGVEERGGERALKKPNIQGTETEW